jgi:hypothetical protein
MEHEFSCKPAICYLNTQVGQVKEQQFAVHATPKSKAWHDLWVGCSKCTVHSDEHAAPSHMCYSHPQGAPPHSSGGTAIHKQPSAHEPPQGSGRSGCAGRRGRSGQSLTRTWCTQSCLHERNRGTGGRVCRGVQNDRCRHCHSHSNHRMSKPKLGYNHCLRDSISTEVTCDIRTQVTRHMPAGTVKGSLLPPDNSAHPPVH